MSLAATPTQKLSRARADLRLGVPIVLLGTGGGHAMLCVAVEALDATRLADLRAFGSLELALTAWRAKTLKARVYDDDLARIAVPKDADLRWLIAVADPADDLQMPMKGPFVSLREGNANLHRAGIALAKSAELLPAVILVAIADGRSTAAQFGLHVLTLQDCDELTRLAPLARVISARVPLAAAAASRVHVFRPDDGATEHYVIEIGQPDRNLPVLARLHSACFTGDVLGSLKCDCGPQLAAALAQMGTEGAGILIYLNQEGRGIGLANKMRAYSLQDQGFDTVDANHRLGFEDDERDFRIGASLLLKMGFNQVRLLTNNPKKQSMLESCGVAVIQRVPLHVGKTAQNTAYLATKVAKSGHLL
jgi:GTP cyclohydrolase II